MKLTPALSGASFFLAMLCAYGFHTGMSDPPGSDFNETVASSAFFFLALTLNGTLAAKFETDRVRVLVAIVSAVFVAIGFVALIVLSIFFDTAAPLILTMGGLTAVYLLVCYGLSKSGQ